MEPLCSPSFLLVFVVFMLSNYMSSFFLVQCCDVHFDFRVKTMFSLKVYFYWCHLPLYTCRVTVTRRMSLVEKELLSLPEHLNSHLVFNGFGVVQSLVFPYDVLKIIVCSFVLFLLHIALSVFIWYTASDYPFGIFIFFSKLYLYGIMIVNAGLCITLADRTPI